MSAADVANDLAHQLELVESERDELHLRLDEAEAVIDGARTVRLDIVALVNGIGSGAGRRERTRVAAFCRVLRMLDEVDGL